MFFVFYAIECFGRINVNGYTIDSDQKENEKQLHLR